MEGSGFLRWVGHRMETTKTNRVPQGFLVLKRRWSRFVEQDQCVDDLDVA